MIFFPSYNVPTTAAARRRRRSPILVVAVFSIVVLAASLFAERHALDARSRLLDEVARWNEFAIDIEEMLESAEKLNRTLDGIGDSLSAIKEGRK